MHARAPIRVSFGLLILAVHSAANPIAIQLDDSGAQPRMELTGAATPDRPACLALRLRAYGVDLVPAIADFGTVDSPWARTANAWPTVALGDGAQQPGAATVQFALHGRGFQAVRATGGAVNGGRNFARLIALVAIDDTHAYAFDCFNASGGTAHRYTIHSQPGILDLNGLDATPVAPIMPGAPLRAYRRAANPDPGWRVDWTPMAESAAPVHLRYTGLTPYAGVYAAECDVPGSDSSIPWIIVERTVSDPELTSTFIGILEPYRERPAIASVRRLPVETMNGRVLPESFTAVAVAFDGLRTDLLLASNGGAGTEMLEPFHDVHFIGAFAWVRLHGQMPERIVARRCRYLRAGSLAVTLKGDTSAVELAYDGDTLQVVQGEVASATRGAERVPVVNAHGAGSP